MDLSGVYHYWSLRTALRHFLVHPGKRWHAQLPDYGRAWPAVHGSELPDHPNRSSGTRHPDASGDRLVGSGGRHTSTRVTLAVFCPFNVLHQTPSLWRGLSLHVCLIALATSVPCAEFDT